MRISKLLYQDFPSVISVIRHLGSINKVNSRGINFKLVSDNWITKYRTRTFDRKEPETLDWIDENVRDDDILFDVGANIGIYSIYAAFRNPNITVYAFEPEYSNLNQLKQNILNNSLQSSIVPFSIALGDNTGISYLHIQDITPGSALHTVSTESLKTTQTGHDVVWKEGVACFTIDDLCEMVGIKPTLIKIDVDGNETEILNGGKKTFKNKELRSVIIEIDKKQTQCENILKNYGFYLEKKPSENQIWTRK